MPRVEHVEGYHNIKIIFVGAISSYKVNFELLNKLAKKNPTWNILMIGQIGEGQPETKIDLLESCSNIHLLGAKNYDDIPMYLHFSDVSIIPANLNDYTKSMFPMKFFEYLSSGLQVVSTNLVSLNHYSNLCYISSSNLEFENNLKLVLDKKESKSPDLILEECLKQTWDERYKLMMEIIK